MTARPDPFGGRGPRGAERWTTEEAEMPDPVDDGIAVGVPPVPEGSGRPRPGTDRPRTESAGTEGTGTGGDVPGPGDLGGGTILTDVAGLAAERDEYLLALQRLQADFENYRKRVDRQREEQSARAALDLVGKLLPVIDTLDLARAHLTGDGATSSDEAAALDQARAQLLDALRKEGLERVDEPEVPFDPVVHDAVARVPDDDGEAVATVDEVMRAGYRWRGQVLRPAMVRVRG